LLLEYDLMYVSSMLAPLIVIVAPVTPAGGGSAGIGLVGGGDDRPPLSTTVSDGVLAPPTRSLMYMPTPLLPPAGLKITPLFDDGLASQPLTAEVTSNEYAVSSAQAELLVGSLEPHALAMSVPTHVFSSKAAPLLMLFQVVESSLNGQSRWRTSASLPGLCT
jgi:hypothetical protein